MHSHMTVMHRSMIRAEEMTADAQPHQERVHGAHYERARYRRFCNGHVETPPASRPPGRVEQGRTLAACTCLLVSVALSINLVLPASFQAASSSLVDRWRPPFTPPPPQVELGLSEGNYSLLDGSTCVSCVDRIQRLCGYRISGMMRHARSTWAKKRHLAADA